MSIPTPFSPSLAKKFVWLISFSVSLIAQAQENPCSTGTIIFVRKAHKLKSAAVCQIRVGDSLSRKLPNWSAVVYRNPPGTYIFTPLIQPGNKKGPSLTVRIEAGELAIIEVNIKQKRKASVIPSESYYFSFSSLHPRAQRKYLQKKEVTTLLKEALWEEFQKNMEGT